MNSSLLNQLRVSLARQPNSGSPYTLPSKTVTPSSSVPAGSLALTFSSTSIGANHPCSISAEVGTPTPARVNTSGS